MKDDNVIHPALNYVPLGRLTEMISEDEKKEEEERRKTHRIYYKIIDNLCFYAHLLSFLFSELGNALNHNSSHEEVPDEEDVIL